MAILDDVKPRIGIFYTEITKDAEITNLIAGAKSYLLNAGWPSADLTAGAETDLAREAIIIYCKQGQNTDPDAMNNNSILTAMVLQARSAAVSTTA